MIHSIRDLYRVVHYSEKKVDAGKARFLFAMGYPIDSARLTPLQKRKRLEMRGSLNPRAEVKGTSIALTFDISEQPDRDLLIRLSTIYMERLGFGEQPYLVYEHMDAPNPHVHIVGSPIRRDGAVIKMDLLKKELSRQTTADLEREFDLVRSHANERLHFRGDRSIGINDVHYNSGPKGPFVNTILATVLAEYRFTSLEEFNALLRPYRLMADRGKPGSNIYIHRGLVYRPLNEEGNPQTSYLKASKLEGKPTLAFLEQRFERDRAEQVAFVKRVRNAVDWSLFPENNRHIDRLRADLQNEGIEMHWQLPKRQEPMPLSLCYVDHQSHWAFGEAVMGETYTATALLRRCRLAPDDLAQALSLTRTREVRTSAEDPSSQWNRGITQ